MTFDYLTNIKELSLLKEYIKKDVDKEQPFLTCLYLGKALEKLVRYVYKEELPSYDVASSELIKLLKERKFKEILGKTEYYNKIQFIYVASNNAQFDHDIDYDTANLALENMREITSILFNKISQSKEDYNEFISDKSNSIPLYVPKINTSISEKKTRKIYIDTNLINAGYSISKVDNLREPGKVGVEIETHYLPNQKVGYADYVIFDKAGLPVAVIEAKRTSINEETGSQQARDYADSLVKDFGLSYRPIVYYTNGYTIKIQDRLGYPARIVSNFASLRDLELLISRQIPGTLDKRKPIVKKEVDGNIVNRSKLVEAIQEVIDSMNVDGEMRRKCLIVLPCGVGKTRMSIALSKILLENNWVKNILFLADRNNLVTNALKPFEKYIDTVVSDISADNPDRNTNARICLCTYNSMLNMLNKPKKEFSTNHFDLIIVDEAHRSLFNVYRSIFEYFDSFVIGLTATPRNDIDKSTYEILDLCENKPTFEIKFEEAVNLQYLVSYRVFDKTSKLMRDGLKYSDLDEKEKIKFEESFGNDIDYVDGKHFYKDIFNNDTIDKMFSDLMSNGLRVNNGTKIGKTLIFAVDHKHAISIVDRFKVKYPYLGDDFCQVIDNQINKNKTRQDNFAKKNSNPQIVVSVDMMDTGVDIPEILNLVFFKKVRSRIKFDQMWGRGTRTCKGLRAITPSRDYFEGRTIDDERTEMIDKQGFFVFDYCNNFKYFEENTGSEPSSNPLNLNQKIFNTKLDILSNLQRLEYQEQEEYKNYYKDLKNQICLKISKLDINKIDVKSKQFYVDKYSDIKNYDYLSPSNIFEFKSNLLKLIDVDTNDEIYGKSFIYRIRIIQLSLLDDKVNSISQQKQIMLISKALLGKPTIEDIFKEKELLKKLSKPDYYDNLEFFKLEDVIKRISPLVKYLDGDPAENIITNFNDNISTNLRDNNYKFDDFMSYREKYVYYIKKHFGELNSINKILNLEKLNDDDLNELQELCNSMKNEDTPDDELFKKPEELILFTRKIIGLDKKAIDEKCAKFLNINEFNKQQRGLINLIIDFAIRNGNITTSDLVNSEPFSNIEIADVFNNEITPLLNLVNMFNNSLYV